MACAYSLNKNTNKAIENLKKAIEINENNKKNAVKDIDFDNIKESEYFKSLRWEAAPGFEPGHKAFAELFLITCLCRFIKTKVIILLFSPICNILFVFSYLESITFVF